MIYIFIFFLIVILIICLKKNKEYFYQTKCWEITETGDQTIKQTKVNDLEETVEKCEQKPNHYIETGDDDYSELDNIKITYMSEENKNLAERALPINITKLLTQPLSGHNEEGNSKTIDQGKVIRDYETKANQEMSTDEKRDLNVVNLDDIENLDDYYKFQILKKKNNVSTDEALNDFEDYGDYDMRYVDTSSGVDNEFEEAEYDPTKKKNITKIGHADLFSRPSKFQNSDGKKYLVSRTYNSDEENIFDCNQKKICDGGVCYPGQGEDGLPITQFSDCKPCPQGLLDTYTFNRGGYEKKYFTHIGGFYSSTDGKPGTPNSLETIQNEKEGEKFKDGYQVCKACDNQWGCRYDKEGNERNTHYEAQSCINGNNRICKECDICDLGTQFALVGCGEGGITQKTVCETCTPCQENTFKVAGCSQYNSFIDNHCIKMNDCKGKSISDNTLSPFYSEDPGEGNRFYMIQDGYPGSYMEDESGKEIGSGKGGEWKNEKYEGGDIINKPYFGKDRECRKCDICPEGTNMIGDGCMGINSKKNSICQRLINVDKYVNKLQNCPEGNFYNREILRKKLTYDHNKTKEENLSDGVDSRVVNFYVKDEEIRNSIKDESERNKLIHYQSNPIPDFSDEEIMSLACVPCNKCENDTYQNPENPGCVRDMDTKCILKKLCKNYEIIIDNGDDKTNRTCGPCKCLAGDYGVAQCENSEIVGGCKKRNECGEGEYKFDNPIQYNDVTRDTNCKPCRKCPPNSFVLAECNNSTDTVCKNHRECGENQYAVKKGTYNSDTICKCLDGYELPTVSDPNDINYGTQDLNASYCVPSKGKCWTNPCHPNAKCYDRFDDNGNFIEYICRCNKDDGYQETEFIGKGVKGCRKISAEHPHDLLGMAPATDYGLTDKINKIMTHEDNVHHFDTQIYHIHKSNGI